MRGELLKVFLIADVTLKDFAKSQGVTSSAISERIQKEIRALSNIDVSDGNNWVSVLPRQINEIRKDREKWLEAIKQYEAWLPKIVKLREFSKKGKRELFKIRLHIETNCLWDDEMFIDIEMLFIPQIGAQFIMDKQIEDVMILKAGKHYWWDYKKPLHLGNFQVVSGVSYCSNEDFVSVALKEL